jgi:3-hydroxyacyl-CoA dehydrogenase/enoyl-CoA hydratase/3-hydroxybutyryl-CoA epimerase/3-hydroxyacyl-CoA dehydrogenase/enoyl-CoA hydratase/3-hydroxybutyryl-CoA epimerase/enoyl-CoA isomerase
LESVGVVGAGLMGTAIVAAHVRHGVSVVVHDVNPTILATVPERVTAELRTAGWSCSHETVCRQVRITSNLAEVASCPLVLEAIIETLPAKQRFFSELARLLSKETIIASNTSTIPLRRMAGSLGDTTRFCGIHFCHPVQERPLVEIIRGEQTDEATITTAAAHILGIEKIPIVVKDGPGFTVNRLLSPCLGEALAMLREGVPAEWIEQAAEDFGMAFGPLRFIDEIGLDTAIQAAWVLAADFPERVVSSPLLVALVKAGRLGKKTGVGFFSHHEPAEENQPRRLDDESAKLLARWIESCDCPSKETVTYRLLLPMLLEATRILQEGNVRDARAIDLAMLFGLGFPDAKGGLLWWADELGIPRILDILKSLSIMGPRAEPTPMLIRMAEQQKRFYSAAR